MKPIKIDVKITVNLPIEKVWDLWTNPDDIMKWNNADESWQNTSVENDIRTGGKFLFAMRKKDGSETFDFTGVYDEVILHKLITYTLKDGRKTILTFEGSNPVQLTESFDPVPNLSADMQRDFCSSVLNTFKNYAETK